MSKFLPCLVAAVLNGSAMQIFREPMKVGNGPLMALYMFIFTTFLLLWSIRLYPSNLRRMGKLQFIIEFLIAEFVMEDLIIDFWFPLEKCVIDSLPALAQTLEDWLAIGDYTAEPLIDFLKDETNGYVVSYAMASFFLIAALHATRFFDLRTLTQEGPSCFIKEIVHKTKLATRRLFRKLGFGKKKVKINENRNTALEDSDYSGSANNNNKNRKPKNGGDPCVFSHSRIEKKGRNPRKVSFKLNEYCPVHNPRPIEDSGSGSDFEDLGKYSDLECL